MKILPTGIAVVENDSHLSKWIEEQGRLDVADGFCRLFERFMPKGAAVADIGACLGDHTASYSKMVGHTGWVHAFEPNRIAAECLALNMREYHNVIIHPYALGDKQGTGHMKPKESEVENLGAMQMMDGGDIRVETLDTVAQHWTKLNFVKIDAEGWEPRIIRGGMKILAKFRPVLLIEVNRPVLHAQGYQDADIFVPLSSLGYRFEPAEPHLDMRSDQVDVLCLPS